MIPSAVEKLIPREKPKLLPFNDKKADKLQPAASTISPDSIDDSSSSSSAAPAESVVPTGSVIQALFGKQPKLPPPTSLDLKPDKNPVIEKKVKESPSPNTDLSEDTSDIRTPPMSPRSPVKPMPPIVELNVPPTPPKASASKACRVLLDTQLTSRFFRISLCWYRKASPILPGKSLCSANHQPLILFDWSMD